MANAFIDLSGVSTSSFKNPYDALIAASQDGPKQMQIRYNTHRTTRNSQKRAELLDASFKGVVVDDILLRLHDPSIEPGYVDTRYCLVFWARPPQKIKQLIAEVQSKLRAVVPNLWLMPQEHLHMTALEITHSKTEAEIQTLVDQLKPAVSRIVNYTLDHRARLIKPMIGYDASAIALSFVPAAGEALPKGRAAADDAYTYHHLRRDLFALSTEAGVKVDSRYIVPSSHLTIGRFLYTKDFAREDPEAETEAVDPEKMQKLIETIEEVNKWLQAEYWAHADGKNIPDGGEWVVGEGKGLDCRQGNLWYGGGKTVELGKGF